MHPAKKRRCRLRNKEETKGKVQKSKKRRVKMKRKVKKCVQAMESIALKNILGENIKANCFTTTRIDPRN
jgi:hypothetical protein